MKRYVPQPYKHRKFHLVDLDVDIEVEETTRKEVFSYLDEFLENLQYSWYTNDDDAFMILYSNGQSDYISQTDYDGHPIRRIGIVSMVYSNPGDCIVYGPYEINANGVVTPSTEMEIDPNIIEVK